MPAATTRPPEKASALSPDSLILHLEHALAPAPKAEPRDPVVAALTAGDYGNREYYVNKLVARML